MATQEEKIRALRKQALLDDRDSIPGFGGPSAPRETGAPGWQRAVVASAQGPGAKQEAWEKWYDKVEPEKDFSGQPTGRFILTQPDGVRIYDNPKGYDSGDVAEHSKIASQVMGGGLGSVIAGGPTFGVGALAGGGLGAEIGGQAHDLAMNLLSGNRNTRPASDQVSSAAKNVAIDMLAPAMLKPVAEGVMNVGRRALSDAGDTSEQVIKIADAHGIDLPAGLISPVAAQGERVLEFLSGSGKVINDFYDKVNTGIDKALKKEFSPDDVKAESYINLSPNELGQQIKDRVGELDRSIDTGILDANTNLQKNVQDRANQLLPDTDIANLDDIRFGDRIKKALVAEADRIDAKEKPLWDKVEELTRGMNITVPNLKAVTDEMLSKSDNPNINNLLKDPTVSRISRAIMDPAEEVAEEAAVRPSIGKRPAAVPDVEPIPLDFKGIQALRSKLLKANRGDAPHGFAGEASTASSDRRRMIEALTEDLDAAVKQVDGAEDAWLTARTFTRENNEPLVDMQQQLIKHNTKRDPQEVTNAFNQTLMNDPTTWHKWVDRLFGGDMPGVKSRAVKNMGRLDPNKDISPVGLKPGAGSKDKFDPVQYEKSLGALSPSVRAAIDNEDGVVGKLSELSKPFQLLGQDFGAAPGKTVDQLGDKLGLVQRQLQGSGQQDLMPENMGKVLDDNADRNYLKAVLLGGKDAAAPGEVKKNFDSMLQNDPDQWTKWAPKLFPREGGKEYAGSEVYKMGQLDPDKSKSTTLSFLRDTAKDLIGSPVRSDKRGELGFSSAKFQETKGNMDERSMEHLAAMASPDDLSKMDNLDTLTKTVQRRGKGEGIVDASFAPGRQASHLTWALASALPLSQGNPLGTAGLLWANMHGSKLLADTLQSKKVRKMMKDRIEDQAKGTQVGPGGMLEPKDRPRTWLGGSAKKGYAAGHKTRATGLTAGILTNMIRERFQDEEDLGILDQYMLP